MPRIKVKIEWGSERQARIAANMFSAQRDGCVTTYVEPDSPALRQALANLAEGSDALSVIITPTTDSVTPHTPASFFSAVEAERSREIED